MMLRVGMKLPLHLGNSVGLGLCSADCPMQLPYVNAHFFGCQIGKVVKLSWADSANRKP